MEEIFCGPAWVAGSRRPIVCRHSAEGLNVEVDGAGVFAVSPEGAVRSLEIDPAAAPGEVVSTLLGPPLILALAQRGIFCLHASAVVAEGRAVVFVGDSGAGKSTLAAYLPGVEVARTAFRGLADDILPVAAANGRPEALPRFPQLALPPERQPGAEAPESLPLARIYLLGPPTPPEAGVWVDAVAPADALVALARHTVAARLFSRELLAAHTEVCARIASQVPVRGLEYPRRREALPRVAEVLRSDLACLPTATG